MPKGVKDYTEIGRRIAAFGRNQKDIARVLGVSQQTTSKKLRGECAILLHDLEALSKAYKVPLTHFFEEEEGDAKLAKTLHRIRTKPGTLQDIVIRASQLRAADLKKLVTAVRDIGR